MKQIYLDALEYIQELNYNNRASVVYIKSCEAFKLKKYFVEVSKDGERYYDFTIEALVKNHKKFCSFLLEKGGFDMNKRPEQYKREVFLETVNKVFGLDIASLYISNINLLLNIFYRELNQVQLEFEF